MGGLFGGGNPKVPAIPAPPPAAAPATMASPQVQATAQNAKARAYMAATQGGTVGTTPQGTSTQSTTAGSTLLGGSK